MEEKNSGRRWELKGKVVGGTGRAAFFTQLDWVQAQCIERLGFTPFPGTLNVEIGEEWNEGLEAVQAQEGIRLNPPLQEFCAGKVLPLWAEGVRGALILPAEDVRMHGRRVLEVMAPVGLRSELGLADGDLITLHVERPWQEDEKLRVDAVLFDLDGTLIDSVNVYWKVLNAALVKIGLNPAPRGAILKAIAHGDFDWSHVLPTGTGEARKEWIQRARTIIAELYPSLFREEVKMIRGADGVLKQIARGGMKIGLVTSTPKNLLRGKLHPLKGTGIEELLDAIVTTDDVEKKKPAADPLIECASRLGIDVHRMAYVGDARTDIRAGHAAGMKTIGVLTGFDGYAELMMENPDAIIAGVTELPHIMKF